MTCQSFEEQGKGGRRRREREEREREGRREGAHHSVQRKRGTQSECHVACSPPRYSFCLSFFGCLCGQAGMATGSNLPPPLLLLPIHPLLPSFSSSLTKPSKSPPHPHLSITPFFPHPSPTFLPLSASEPSFCCVHFPNCILSLFFSFWPPPPLPSPHSPSACQSPTGVPVHHNSWAVEVCEGVLRCVEV